MAMLSDLKGEARKNPAPSSKQFSASLDPSNPLGFLEKVFEFVARESDLFQSDTVVNEVNAVARTVKDRVEGEERKRKELEVEENGKAEKKLKEEEAAAPQPSVKAGDLKKDKAEEEKERVDAVQVKNGPRGTISHANFFFMFHLINSK